MKKSTLKFGPLMRQWQQKIIIKNKNKLKYQISSKLSKKIQKLQNKITASFKPISLCLDSNTEEDLIKNETKQWNQKWLAFHQLNNLKTSSNKINLNCKSNKCKVFKMLRVFSISTMSNL